ncbi:DUF6445 family protein [Sphingomonas lenta]|uniref:TauD/TfdA-like domain-containing protein n=1 Tax=Sphingomonas lenta TaxID=1141887 RepID=A0A2A2SEJ0_9SPHN|nr:DUF6445 family protein [Sphingomonas lenta]PAX07615.1 hypothetical protein CKY28_08160 [Sphingomonas lenta]
MSGPDIKARLIGRELQPLVVVDGFAPDPDALRAAAVAASFGPAGRHYPGIRASLPPDYLPAQAPVIATVLREVFGCARSMRLLDASYSIVTAAPDKLAMQQRLPHVDAVAPGRIALVHYLSPEGGDGTAFFRHRSTGFETIDEARAPTYFGRLAAELRRSPPPPAYVAGDTPLFERFAHAEARYNRALIYRSSLLHSGAISEGSALSPDPTVGRLTITAFLEAS